MIDQCDEVGLEDGRRTEFLNSWLSAWYHMYLTKH